MKARYILPVCFLLLAVCITSCGKSSPAVQEETAASKALAAYREILNAAPAITGEHAQLQDASFSDEQNRALFGNHYDCFALTDLNQDGIPELITSTTINFRWSSICVYTCTDGTAVLLKDPVNGGQSSSFEQCSTAGGAYITYFCAGSHIHSVWRGSTPVGEVEENTAYSLNAAFLAAAECTIGENEKTVFFSEIAKANTAENVAAMKW